MLRVIVPKDVCDGALANVRLSQSGVRLALTDIVTEGLFTAIPQWRIVICALHRDSNIHEANHNAATG